MAQETVPDMSDKVRVRLLCPECGRQGEAIFIEQNDHAYAAGFTEVHVRLPEGFERVDRPTTRWGFDVWCEDCNGSALPNSAPIYPVDP